MSKTTVAATRYREALAEIAKHLDPKNENVRRGDLVDNSEIDALAPEFRKPSADNGLVIFFLAHWNGSS